MLLYWRVVTLSVRSFGRLVVSAVLLRLDFFVLRGVSQECLEVGVFLRPITQFKVCLVVARHYTFLCTVAL